MGALYLLRLTGLLVLLGSGTTAALEGRPWAFLGALLSASGAAGCSCAFPAAALPFPCKEFIRDAAVFTLLSLHLEHSNLPCLKQWKLNLYPLQHICSSLRCVTQRLQLPQKVDAIRHRQHHSSGAAMALVTQLRPLPWIWTRPLRHN